MKTIGIALAYYNDKKVATFKSIDLKFENYVAIPAPFPEKLQSVSMEATLISSRAKFEKYKFDERTLFTVVVNYERMSVLKGDFYIKHDPKSQDRFIFELSGTLVKIDQ